MRLRGRGGAPLGEIEEGFAAALTPGDSFLIGGEVVRYEGLREMTVEVSREGQYLLDRKPMTLAQLDTALGQAHQKNPDTIVYIRADQMGYNRDVYAVIDACQRHGLDKFSLRTKEGGQ